jgi:para-nitrobenzyl esterase
MAPAGGLPAWPAFTPSEQTAIHFGGKPTAGPVPNMTQIKALDDYYAWRRDEAKTKRPH